MPQRNLYLVLGLTQDASPNMIRAAYRALAKAHHPDRIGPSDASAFSEINEAYRVLSDPRRRGTYDDELQSHSPPAPPAAGARYRRADIEPMAEPVVLRRSFRASLPSGEEEFLEWTKRYSTDRRVPKSYHNRYADLQLILSPDQARAGGILPIEVPVYGICPDCAGSGRDWFSLCFGCAGTGVVEGYRTRRLQIPSMVRDGTMWDVSMPEAGLCLRVLIRIDPLTP
ncbi:MAG: DnaJ domain-containing protein [Candidatus Binatia bacterium]